MWRCITYKNYFEQVSYLSSQSILCDAYNMRRGGASGVSCHKITPPVFGVSPALYLEISTRVAVVTGTAPETGNLYGISNNGLTYVVSTDSGVTWKSLQDDDYSTATSNSSFIWSTFS
ncbi:unnamed protein product [Lymnaea stagnalis]|uniref:Uncharacterized protein n=1 Tax=Lymnaea stagnalis TaxID=6523 RepID=A0AAV2HCZ9_LYMST